MKRINPEIIGIIILSIVGVAFVIGWGLLIFIRVAKDFWQWALV